MGRSAELRRRHGERQAEDLHPGDVPLSVGAHPHGPRPQLHDGRRPRPIPPDAGARGSPPHGLGRVRHARRKCGDGARRPSGRLDPQQHRQHACPAQAAGLRAGLEPRARDLRPRLLRARTGAVPRPLRSRPRLPQGERGQLGPGRPDGARQRAGDRRQGLALRSAGRAAAAVAMVPEDHGLRRGASRRAGGARGLAGQGQADAGELDRQKPRPAVPLPPRRGRVDRQRRGFHDSSRHDFRRELRRHRTDSSDRRSRRRERSGSRRVHRRVPSRRHQRRGNRDRGEEGLSHSRRGYPPPRPGLASARLHRELRADGLWHGRHFRRSGA